MIYLHSNNDNNYIIYMYGYNKKKPKTMSITLDNDSILKLLDSTLAEFLLIVIRQTNKSNYKWYSTKGNRSELMARLELSPPTVSRYIAKLKTKNILQHSEYSARGEYRLNSKIITL